MVKASFKASPKGQEPPTREEVVDGERMQANPAYLPIEMTSYELHEHQYMYMKLAAADAEKHTKLQAYLPIEMMSYQSQENKYINVSS